MSPCKVSDDNTLCKTAMQVAICECLYSTKILIILQCYQLLTMVEYYNNDNHLYNITKTLRLNRTLLKQYHSVKRSH